MVSETDSFHPFISLMPLYLVQFTGRIQAKGISFLSGIVRCEEVLSTCT